VTGGLQTERPRQVVPRDDQGTASDAGHGDVPRCARAARDS
jgi:hypothetical protein